MKPEQVRSLVSSSALRLLQGHPGSQQEAAAVRMAAPAVAAAGAAVALYFSYRARVASCGVAGAGSELSPLTGNNAFRESFQAPNTWLEALFFFAEALRCAAG